jgi:hypothetical protein
MAARYVVDRSGIVRGADVNPDYTVRRDPEETLRARSSSKVRLGG